MLVASRVAEAAGRAVRAENRARAATKVDVEVDVQVDVEVNVEVDAEVKVAGQVGLPVRTQEERVKMRTLVTMKRVQAKKRTFTRDPHLSS